MTIIEIDNVNEINSAVYGRYENIINVLDIIKNLINNNEFTFIVSNNIFGEDPCENIIKCLKIKVNTTEYTIYENDTITFKLNKIIVKDNKKINYYFVITDDDLEYMIDYYFKFFEYIINNCNHNYIKVNCKSLLEKINITENNIIILYKSFLNDNDIDIVKKKSLKIYFLNVEQLSVLVDDIDNCDLTENIQKFLLKTVKFTSKHNISLIDYSYENKEIWKKKYYIDDVVILEPCLNKNVIKEKEKSISYISLFNHISYRHNFLKKYLKYLDIKSFSGYFGEKRRELFCESKILLNIHAGKHYKICELFRIYEAIAHKIIVISQKCNNHKLISLNKFIIFTDDDNYLNTCKNTLENYDTIYNNLYKDISIDDIFKNIIIKYKSFFCDLSEHLI